MRPLPARSLALVALAALAPNTTVADGAIERFWKDTSFELDTEVVVEWATDLDTGDAQKVEGRIEPELEVDFPAGVRLVTIGRWLGDAFDRMWKGDTRPAEVSWQSRPRFIGNKMETELREFYLEGRTGRAHWRLGKQQVVWGQADGLKVLDVVNPQSFREFILADFDVSRIPLWTVNVDVPVGPASMQLLWVPDASGHALAPDGSVFEFQAEGLAYPRSRPGLDVVVEEVDRPTRVFADSDAGVRVTSFLGGWDLSLNYLYHYQDFAVPFRKTDLSGPTPTLRFQPEYERTHLAGGTFSNAFGDLTVRGEVGFAFERYYPTARLSDSNGVVRTNELGYVLGFDWYGFDETVLSAQFFHSWVTRNANPMIRDENEGVATLLFQRDFLNDALVVENLWLHDLRKNDGMMRPKVTYEVQSGLLVYLGFDWFYGTKNGLFGQFDDRDRVLLGLEWGF